MKIDVFELGMVQVVYADGELLGHADLHYDRVISASAASLLEELGAEVNWFKKDVNEKDLHDNLYLDTLSTLGAMLEYFGENNE